MELFAAKLAKRKVERSFTDPRTVERLIATLTPQEQNVVRLRIGLGSSSALTLNETAEIIGLSSGRIGQIEDKAFRKIKWVCNNIDINDQAALDELVTRREADAAEKEQIKEREALEKVHAAEQKRAARQERDEIRRAKARDKAWTRKLHQAEATLERLKSDALFVSERITHLQRRGAFLRAVMPHERQMAELRAQADTLADEIVNAEASVVQIRSSPPEGPQLNHESTTAQGD